MQVTLSNFAEPKKNLADTSAAVLINDIPLQTAIQAVPTGQWTMNQVRGKLSIIAHSDDKQQMTAVIAASMSSSVALPRQESLRQSKTVSSKILGCVA